MTALWLANTSDNANAVSVLEAEAKPTTISKHRSYLAAAFHTTSPDRICWIINTPNVWWRVSSMGHYMFNGYICFVFLFYWGFNKPVVSHIKSHIWRQHNLLWLTLWLDLKKKKNTCGSCQAWIVNWILNNPAAMKPNRRVSPRCSLNQHVSIQKTKCKHTLKVRRYLWFYEASFVFTGYLYKWAVVFWPVWCLPGLFYII